MENNFVTTEDLNVFRQELMDEIRSMLNDSNAAYQPQRRWLKSHEVRRMLTISPGKLQAMRLTGVLPFSKIGGVFLYAYDDIMAMLEQNKCNRLDDASACSS